MSNHKRLLSDTKCKSNGPQQGLIFVTFLFGFFWKFLCAPVFTWFDDENNWNPHDRQEERERHIDQGQRTERRTEEEQRQALEQHWIHTRRVTLLLRFSESNKDILCLCPGNYPRDICPDFFSKELPDFSKQKRLSTTRPRGHSW